MVPQQSNDSHGANIILTGFMGTGKSLVGSLLAAELQRPFIDMDLELERRFGQPIPAVFAKEGEAIFRAAESQLCAELARQRGLVIATGGGALVDGTNRQRMAESGILICLTAQVETILARVGADTNRPLLQTEDAASRRQRIETLLARRREAYQSIPLQIDTTDLSAEAVVARIVQLYAGERIR